MKKKRSSVYYYMNRFRSMHRLSFFLPLFLVTLGSSHLRGEERYPQVYRNFLPEAGPSAFGVVLNHNTALCYDPLRGGVNQLWHGKLDLSPTFQAKINQPAILQGNIFYQEKTLQPFRVKDPEKVPMRRFKGYSYASNSVTFHFTLDGIEVSETLQATEDGKGIIRSFNLPTDSTFFYKLDPQQHSKVTLQGAKEISPGTWQLPSNSPVSMTIQSL